MPSFGTGAGIRHPSSTVSFSRAGNTRTISLTAFALQRRLPDRGAFFGCLFPCGFKPFWKGNSGLYMPLHPFGQRVRRVKHVDMPPCFLFSPPFSFASPFLFGFQTAEMPVRSRNLKRRGNMWCAYAMGERNVRRGLHAVRSILVFHSRFRPQPPSPRIIIETCLPSVPLPIGLNNRFISCLPPSPTKPTSKSDMHKPPAWGVQEHDTATPYMDSDTAWKIRSSPDLLCQAPADHAFGRTVGCFWMASSEKGKE
jgi:hypothetical protein